MLFILLRFHVCLVGLYHLHAVRRPLYYTCSGRGLARVHKFASQRLFAVRGQWSLAGQFSSGQLNLLWLALLTKPVVQLFHLCCQLGGGATF